MSVDWIDVIAIYLFGLKYVMFFTAAVLFLLGLDDLLVDVSYWVRRVFRVFSVYRRNPHADQTMFDKNREQPIAIMIPAWQESEIIGSMLTRLVATFDYENYHVFVGVYPNDANTQAAVDPICQRDAHVHKVVCARPGPTTKADCLNNIVQGIFAFEQRTGVAFLGFVLHDAEDVIGERELRLFNHLLPDKDMIQLPVYPLPVPWHHFTAWHYADEFAEQHSKDLVIREALLGQVPSAGVGTCFSRKAMLRLAETRGGQPFDSLSLTEDYEIALRLHRWGLKQVFVRFPSRPFRARDNLPGSNVVATREYFPDHFRAAVRQKSRWTIGIALQGWRNVGWPGGPLLKYFLWRDRRGLVGHPIAFLANVVLLHIVVILAYEWLATDPWRFMSIFADDGMLMSLLIATGVLLLNRVVHRIWFVSAFYGLQHGLLSVVRVVWSNLINFVSMLRALRQFFAISLGNRLAWDKTTHAFPDIPLPPPATPLGRILIDDGVLDEATLDRALTERRPWERLDETLIRLGFVSPKAVAHGLARQAGVRFVSLDPRDLRPELLGKLPANIARRYAVVPMADDGNTLVLASEAQLPSVRRNALRRRLGQAVEYVIVPQGVVTVALRIHYEGQTDQPDPVHLLQAAQQAGRITEQQAEAIWHRFVHGQYRLSESLIHSGLLEPSEALQALISHESSDLPLGEHLVTQGYITRETLDAAVADQRANQPDMETLLAEAGVPDATELVAESSP